MRELNPLHIGALLLVVLIFGFFKLSGAKEELKNERMELKEMTKMAQELSTLKKVYGDKNKLLASLNRIVRQPSLKSADLKQKVHSHSVVITSQSMSAKQLRSLLTKVLNGTYNITQLSIQHKTNENVSLQMEIQW